MKIIKRKVMAWVLSMLMVLSLFGNITYNSYASSEPGDDVVSESTTIDSFLNHVTVYTDHNGTLYNPNVSYPEDQVFTFRLEFMETHDEMAGSNQFDKYTTFTYELPDGLTVKDGQSDDIYFAEHSQEPVGNFVIANGVITVTLDNSYVNAYNNATCWLSFDATLALSDEETEKTITFPDGGSGKEVTIKVDTEPGITTSKSATYDSSTKKASYTVIATVKNGDMSNVNITDLMGTDLAYEGNISYIITNADGTSSAQGSITPDGTTNSFSDNIGTLAKGSTITLTYEAKIDEKSYMNNKVDDTDNTVTVTGDYEFGGEKKTATSTASFNIDDKTDFYYNWIDKSGTLDEGNGVVNWTITVNPSREYALNGFTLSDVLGDYLKLGDDFEVTVTKSDGANTVSSDKVTVSKANNGFEYIFNDTEKYSYEFTYSTPYNVSGEFGDIKLINTATLSSDVLDPVSDPAEVIVGSTAPLGKLVAGYEPPVGDDPGTVTWMVSMTVPGTGLNNAYIIDTLPSIYKDRIYYCNIDASSVSVTGTTVNPIITDTSATDGQVKFDFGDLPASADRQPYTVVITYTTNINENFELYNSWLRNSAKLYVNDVHKSTAEATQQYVPPAEVDKTASVEANGYITYTVQIDPSQIGFFGNNVTIDDVFDTDTMEYVDGSAILYGSNDKWFNRQNYGPIYPTPNETNTGITFELGELDTNTYYDSKVGADKYYVYYLTYQLKIKDDVLKSTQGAIAVKNTANLYQGNLLADSDDADATYNNNIINKNLDAWPSKDNNARVMFSVVLNEGQLDLVPNSDDITLVDTMSSNLTLDLSTVKLYEYKSVADGWEKYDYVDVDSSEYTIIYDNVNNKISINIPGGDGKRFKLSYGAAISGLLGSTQTVTNEVYIQGTDISDNIGSLEYTITAESTSGSDQSAGASGSESYLEINKYDSLVATKVLAGARFELYKVNMEYDGDANTYKFSLIDEVLGSYVSNESGIAKVDYKDFLNNGVYLLRETKAPSGYKLDEAIGVDGTATATWVDIYESDYVFIFQNSTEQTTEEQLEILINSNLPVVNSGGQVMIPNQRKGLTVTATKNLVGRNMEEGEFKFTLIQCDENGNIIDGGQTATGTNGAAVMDETTKIATSTITFDDITYETLEFPEEDTVYHFYYRLKEEDLDAEDIIYDDLISAVISVQVSVDQYGDMQIEVNNANLDGDYASGVTFTNIYEGNLYTSYDIEATKQVNYEVPTDSQIFAFDLVQVDEHGDKVADGYSETVYNTKGVIDFSTLSFTEAGKYYYKITERNAGNNEYDYDDSEFIVCIETVVNTTTGLLEAKPTITKTVDGNTTEVEDIVFNNAYIPMTSVSVEKVWLDGNNASNTRDTITVELLANGSRYGDDNLSVVELKAEDGYKYTWNNLPTKANITGDTIEYTVVETVVPSGYASVVTGNMADGFVITNTLLTSVSGTKTWSDGNDNHISDTISVTLYADGIAVDASNGGVAEVSSANNWKYEFKDVPMYNAEGKKIVYTVKEKNNSSNASDYIAEVNGYDITNTKAKTTVNLAASKELLGETLKDNMFSFTLTLVADNGNVEDTPLETVKNSADGTVNFAPITYSTAGTYTYQIAEVAGTENYDYDETKFTAVVTVTKNADNSLSSSVKYYNGSTEITKPVFTNTKLDSFADVIFSGTKSVTGTAVTNGFTFNLYEGSLGTDPVQSKNNDGGTFTFEKITVDSVTDATTLTYFIREDSTIVRPGYTYDDSVYKVEVSFVGDANNGYTPVYKYTKYATLTDAQNGVSGSEATAVAFENTYTATGSLTIPVTKTYQADSGETGEFEFVLSGGKDDTLNLTVTVTDDSNSSKGSFQTLSYRLADVGKTYNYKITETLGGLAGVTYDDTEYNLVVDISDNGDGTLKVDTKVYKGAVSDGVLVNLEDGIVFNNQKTTDGELKLKASKTIVTSSGETKTVTDGQFSFRLTGDAPVDFASKTISDEKTNDASGNINFDTITYTLSDVGKTYTYTICESSTSEQGYTIDDTIYAVNVEVTAQQTADGGYKIVPIATYQKTVNGINSDITADDVKFENTYDAVGGVDITAKKTLDGGTLAANQYEFILSENGTTIDTAKNAADGTVTFDTISYDYGDIGTHTYTITEKKGSDGHIVYSSDVYTVVVEVADNEDGTLEITEKQYKGDATTGTPLSSYSNIEFVNKVIANTGVAIQGKKNLTGANIAPNQFEFQLKDSNGNVIQTVKNNAAGEFAFDDIEFTASAIGETYEFTVEEVNGGVDGYTYDDSYYKINVTVELEEANGTLIATSDIVKYDRDGVVEDANPSAIEFNNTYNITNSLIIEATKTVAGENTNVVDGAYEFILSDASGVLQTKANVGSKVTFDEIEYSTADSGKKFIYTIAEKDLGDPNTTYDSNYYTVIVEVSDNGLGTLALDTTYYKGDEATGTVVSDIEFVNIVVSDGSFVAVAEKTLVGRTIDDGDFEFKLSGDAPADSASTTITLTATNDGSGNVVFDAIEYSMNDVGKTYNYEISEVTTDNSAYTYDTKVYEVEVEVSYDDVENKIVVTPIISLGGNRLDKIEFYNIYESRGSATIEGKKYLNDKLTDEKFTFSIYRDAACTQILATVTNDDNGEFSFRFTYDEADMKGLNTAEYTYYVKEIVPANKPMGYTYDETVYPVTVVLFDMLDNGEITTAVNYPNNNICLEIYNTYKERNVAISKVDLVNGDELPGANLIITDESGAIVEKWTSSKAVHIIPANTFTVDEEYTLTEITAPEGYELAESIVFKVDSAGDVYVKVDGVFTLVTDGLIVMKDAPTVSQSTSSTNTPTKPSSDSSVATGDTAHIDKAFILMLMSILGIYIFGFKKKRDWKE